MLNLKPYAAEILQIAKDCGALLFSEDGFKLKSGRISPYFLNAALINGGKAFKSLGGGYAQALFPTIVHVGGSRHSPVIFGPAYKGISLAAIASMGLFAEFGIDVPIAYNRKEAKTYGDGNGSLLVGAELSLEVGKQTKRRVVYAVDDVMTSGKTAKETAAFIDGHGGTFAGLAVICDRKERGLDSGKSALREVEDIYGFKPSAIFTFFDVLAFAQKTQSESIVSAMLRYHDQYGVE